MDRIIISDIIEIFKEIKTVIDDKKEELLRLDSVMGDGDLGLTMEAGFTKICDNFIKLEGESNISNFLKKSGFAMAGAAPSTMGTLVATGIMKSGDPVKDKEYIELEDLPKMLMCAISSIEMRGKAKRGEKTLLDSLYPALEEMEKSIKVGGSFATVIEAAYGGTKQGVQDTKALKSVHGKAAIYGEKSIGKQDPGATAVMFIFQGINNYFKKF